MTIIADYGDYHVESIRVVFNIEDAAGEYVSADINLEQGGRYMGSSTTINGGASNDNSQRIAAVQLGIRAPVAKDAFFGDEITQVRARLLKDAGTAGSTAVAVEMLIWIRKA